MIMYYDTGLMTRNSVPGNELIFALCGGGSEAAAAAARWPWMSCASSRRRTACGACTCACDTGSTNLAGCLRWQRCLQEVRLRRLCGGEFKVRVHDIN
jgi:hypothetical protein